MFIQNEITQLITQALRLAQETGALPNFDLPSIIVERPKDPTYGDFAVPSALGLARFAKMAPLKIAEIIVANMGKVDYLASAEVVPPGFINLRLSDTWLVTQIETVLTESDSFGRLSPYLDKRGSKPPKIQVEFISANPTGPLTVGSGRNAVIGDTLANVLSAAGYNIQREYYVNDVGTQIEQLAKALYVRYAQALGYDIPTYKQYTGDYLIEIGKALAEECGEKYLAEPPENYANTRYVMKFMRKEAVNRIVATVKEDTALIGVDFDRWFSERSLYENGTYEFVYDKLNHKDLLIEKDEAIWLRSEDEDDKDNVIIRSDGRPTYFASDIAYAWDKLALRKFNRAIYVWGADHHGHVKRLKNAAQLLGLDPDQITIILYQLINITRDGVLVPQGKRTGNFTTVREVVDEIGADAFRYMLLTRSADSAMELDLELAKRESSENPVYYVQYAHARIISIFRKAKAEGATMGGGDVNLLEHPSELTLIRQILRLPEVVYFTAENMSPHQLTYYAQELATAFHAFYRDCKVVIDDDELTAARLKLVKAAQIALANTLRLMGMSVPHRM